MIVAEAYLGALLALATAQAAIVVRRRLSPPAPQSPALQHTPRGYADL